MYRQKTVVSGGYYAKNVVKEAKLYFGNGNDINIFP